VLHLSLFCTFSMLLACIFLSLSVRKSIGLVPTATIIPIFSTLDSTVLPSSVVAFPSLLGPAAQPPHFLFLRFELLAPLAGCLSG
jgi:hypothetical protein